MPRGPKPKLTKEVQDAIVSYIQASNYFSPACWAAGITPQSGFNWLKKGEELEAGIYHDFWVAVNKAEAEAEIADIAYIKLSRPGWQSRAWIRERRSKERWSTRTYQEIKVIGKVGSGVEDMTDDELYDIIKNRGSRGASKKKTGKEQPD